MDVFRELLMRYLLLSLLLIFSVLAPAQDLVEFENGQVANADDLNQSLQFLLQKIEALEARVTYLEPFTGNCLSNRNGYEDGVLLAENENHFGLTDELTIAAWVKMTGSCALDCPGDCSLHCSVLSLEQTDSDSFANNSGAALIIADTTLQLRFATDDTVFLAEASSSISSNEWVHVASVRNGSTVKLYINGSLDYQASDAGTSNFKFNGSSYDHSKNFIGKGYPNGTVTNLYNGFAGQMSRVALWRRALSDSEIEDVYRTKRNYSQYDPLGYWSLDASAGAIATDEGSSSTDGVLQGNAGWQQECF